MQLTDADANGVNRRTVAVIAGISYLALFAVGIFGNFMVREQLVVADDPTATLQNLAESETLVRLAIVGFIAAFVLDVLVAWALFHVFRPAGADLSRLTCWFRIVYTVFLGVAVVFLFGALELAGDASHVVAIESAARESQAMLALDAFDATWLVGLTCFGVHLALLGAMMLRYDLGPRLLGAILVAAGCAYVFDTIAYTLVASYADHASVFTAIVAVPAVLAEAGLAIWLLTRAGRDTNPPLTAAPRRPDLVGAVQPR